MVIFSVFLIDLTKVKNNILYKNLIRLAQSDKNSILQLDFTLIILMGIQI